MDGSEPTQMEVETTLLANNVCLTQPKVIVERIQEVVLDNVIVEEVITEEGQGDVVVETDDAVAMDSSEQNGEPVKPTLNDLIQEAISADDEHSLPPKEGVEEEEDEKATPALVERKKEAQPELDLNQCRCCKGHDELTDIFGPLKEGENETRICDNLKKICTNVTITKRDHLPHLICKNCLDKLQNALDFKALCEETEREMRKNLPRSKAQSRKGTYTIIDYESSENDDKEDDGARTEDEDFKLSDEITSKSEDSDVSLSEEQKPKRRGRKPKPKAITPAKVVTPARGTASRGRGRPRKDQTSRGTTRNVTAEFVYVDAKAMAASDSEESEEQEEDDEEESEEDVKPTLVKATVKKVAVAVAPIARPAAAAASSPATASKPCPKCKAPIGRGPHKCKQGFGCTFCNEKFPTHAIYMNHQQLHSNFQAVSTCIKCHKKLVSKVELRKHQTTVRCNKATKNECPLCHRTLMNANQLAIHLRTKCQSSSTSSPIVKKEPTGTTPAKKNPEDIFKHVAPNTSTYWSDSYSD